MKNNFTQALRELTGFDGQSDSSETSLNKDSAAPNFSEDIIEEKVSSSSVKTVKDFSESSQDTCTRITSTMIITGDIKSSDNVHIHGQVFGNVKTNATVYATDLILGNVSAQSGFF